PPPAVRPVPYTTLFRSHHSQARVEMLRFRDGLPGQDLRDVWPVLTHRDDDQAELHRVAPRGVVHPREHGPDRLARREAGEGVDRSEEHTSELQSPDHLV